MYLSCGIYISGDIFNMKYKPLENCLLCEINISGDIYYVDNISLEIFIMWNIYLWRYIE